MHGISRPSLGRALRVRQDRCACKGGGCLSMKGQADWLNSRTATDLVQEPSPLPTCRVPFILLLFSCQNQLSCQSIRVEEVGNEPSPEMQGEVKGPKSLSRASRLRIVLSSTWECRTLQLGGPEEGRIQSQEGILLIVPGPFGRFAENIQVTCPHSRNH